MATEKNQLDIDEVNRRLNFASPEVADKLYSFGLAMLAEVDERFEYLDKKASGIAGYSGAIVALIISTAGTWPKAIDPCMVPLVLMAGVVAFVAGGLAFLATRTMELISFSPNDWLRGECIKNGEELTKYWVSCIYVNRQTYRERCAQKAKWIGRAQYCFLVAGFLLFIALLDAAWFSGALLDRLRVG